MGNEKKEAWKPMRPEMAVLEGKGSKGNCRVFAKERWMEEKRNNGPKGVHKKASIAEGDIT